MIALQVTFDLKDDAGYRPSGKPAPLMSIGAIMDVYQLKLPAIQEELEQGRIRWAFNLSRDDTNRVFLRVWRRSMICWKNSNLHQAETLEGVMDELFPRLPAFTAVEVSDVFALQSSDHVHNLIEDKCLALAPGQAKLSRTQSPQITRDSLARFLKTRQWP